MIFSVDRSIVVVISGRWSLEGNGAGQAAGMNRTRKRTKRKRLRKRIRLPASSLSGSRWFCFYCGGCCCCFWAHRHLKMKQQKPLAADNFLIGPICKTRTFSCPGRTGKRSKTKRGKTKRRKTKRRRTKRKTKRRRSKRRRRRRRRKSGAEADGPSGEVKKKEKMRYKRRGRKRQEEEEEKDHYVRHERLLVYG